MGSVAGTAQKFSGQRLAAAEPGASTKLVGTNGATKCATKLVGTAGATKFATKFTF